jgi:hypothetical protein
MALCVKEIEFEKKKVSELDKIMKTERVSLRRSIPSPLISDRGPTQKLEE